MGVECSRIGLVPLRETPQSSLAASLRTRDEVPALNQDEA